jgi:hypothetical protein
LWIMVDANRPAREAALANRFARRQDEQARDDNVVDGADRRVNERIGVVGVGEFELLPLLAIAQIPRVVHTCSTKRSRWSMEYGGTRIRVRTYERAW